MDKWAELQSQVPDRLPEIRRGLEQMGACLAILAPSMEEAGMAAPADGAAASKPQTLHCLNTFTPSVPLSESN